MIAPGFENGPVLDYADATIVGGVILNDALFGNGATSEPNILATCDTCLLGDFQTGLPGMITGGFTTTASSISPP